MRISNVRVLLLSAPIPPERRWTSDFGTNTKQDLAIVIVDTDDGLTGYGEAKGTPVLMKVLVEDVLGPQLVGDDPTRVELLCQKMYSASRLLLALAHGRPYHRAGSRRRADSSRSALGELGSKFVPGHDWRSGSSR